MTLQLIVFDLAGTTVNDPGGVNGCFRAAMAAAGVDVTPEAADEVMGIPKPEAIRHLIGWANRCDLLCRADEIHADFVARMSSYYRDDPTICEVPGTTRVFNLCRRAGIAVAVDTGFDRKITDVLLHRLGWLERRTIDASIASDEVARGRPYPDMIIKLMTRIGVTDPRRVAKVGDTPSDLHEGKNADCRWIIGVTNGTHTHEQLALHPHTHLINTVDDLPLVLPLNPT